MSDLIYVTWDIETVANDRAKDYYAGKKYAAPKNWKDKDKIEQYVTEARHEDMEKAALSWWTGKVVCIGYKAHLDGAKTRLVIGPAEADVLRTFFDEMLALKSRVVLLGKSSDTFDVPFVRGRALALDLGVPSFLRPFRQIEDVDHIFGFGSRASQASKLDDYAFGLGIDAKSGYGTDVQNWYNLAIIGDDKMWSKIAEYCAGDVDITHEMLRRWMKPYGSSAAPTMTKYTPPADTPRLPSPNPSELPFNIDDVFGPTKTAAPAHAPKAMEF